jgi:hypothetical protein
MHWDLSKGSLVKFCVKFKMFGFIIRIPITWLLLTWISRPENFPVWFRKKQTQNLIEEFVTKPNLEF